MNYQWFRGTTGQTFAPQAFGSKPRFVTPALSSVTEFWVRATDFLGQSADSDSATVTPNGAPEQGTYGGWAGDPSNGFTPADIASPTFDSDDPDGDGLGNLVE